MKSINNISLSGRLTSDARTNDAKNFAKFTLAHNMGKDNALFIDFTMFSRNGKNEKTIPWDLLKKGTPVKVEAFMRNNLLTNQETGEVTKVVQFVVKSVSPITEAEAEAADESEAE